MIIPTNYIKNIDDLSTQDKSFVLDYLEKNYTAEIFYNQEIMIAMKKIFFDMSFIYEVLECLEHAGLNFTLSLVGVALRDLLSENYNLIKDLDIVLSINNIHDYSKNQTVSSLTHIESNPKLKELISDCEKKYENWLSWDIDKKIATLVEAALSKKLKIKRTYVPLDLPKDMEHNGIFRSNYHNIFLRGVIKLEDDKLRYPADILICNSSAEDYVNTFDFNICKVMLSITSQQFKEMTIKFNWDTLEKIKNQIIPFNEFWLDMSYKKLTLNPIGFDMNALERAIVEHLPRIQNKYSGHKLSLIEYNHHQEINHEVKTYLEKMSEFIILNEKLPTKQDSKKIKSVKI